MNAVDERQRRRNRRTLLVIAALFFGSMLVAGILRFSGWQPAAHKNHGVMLQPPVDARDLSPALADGGRYDWTPAERRWRIVAAPSPGCTQACTTLAQDLDKVWQLFGHNADKVEILWLGALPPGAPALTELRPLRDDGTLRAALPRADDPAGIPLYVIDPNGFVILRYPPQADPAGIRTDVARLLKLK